MSRFPSTNLLCELLKIGPYTLHFWQKNAPMNTTQPPDSSHLTGWPTVPTPPPCHKGHYILFKKNITFLFYIFNIFLCYLLFFSFLGKLASNKERLQRSAHRTDFICFWYCLSHSPIAVKTHHDHCNSYERKNLTGACLQLRSPCHRGGQRGCTQANMVMER